jgi:hypothetical protein
MGNRQRRRSPRLEVEQLECRVVPSTVTPPATPPVPYYGWGSTNWSGMDLNTKPGGVTGVSGSWTVAQVPQTSSPTPTALSASWVGIDGFSSSTVEQIGTGSDTNTYAGLPSYYAWYEMYPAGIVQITTAKSTATSNLGAQVAATVGPGDAISASVAYGGSTTSGHSGPGGKQTTTSTFTLTITDLTQQWTYSTTQTVQGSPQRSSAEWIEEAPSSSTGVLPLADFGSVTFTDAQATLGGATGSIASFVGNPAVLNYGTAAQPRPINLIDMGTFNRQGQWTSILAETSLLNSAGAFTVFFETSGSSQLGYGTAQAESNVLGGQTNPSLSAPFQLQTTPALAYSTAALPNVLLVQGTLNQPSQQTQPRSVGLLVSDGTTVTDDPNVSQTQLLSVGLPAQWATASPDVVVAPGQRFFVFQAAAGWGAQSLPKSSSPLTPPGTQAPVMELDAADPASNAAMANANPEGAGSPMAPVGPQAQPAGVWDGDLVWRADEVGRLELCWANAATIGTAKSESNADSVPETILALALGALWIHSKEEEEYRRRRADFGAIV